MLIQGSHTTQPGLSVNQIKSATGLSIASICSVAFIEDAVKFLCYCFRIHRNSTTTFKKPNSGGQFLEISNWHQELIAPRD